jgi:hypothetical protein
MPKNAVIDAALEQLRDLIFQLSLAPNPREQISQDSQQNKKTKSAANYPFP